MFLARWQIKAKFGHQGDVLGLMKDWDDAVGSQLGIDPGRQRYLTGHIGSAESLIVSEFEIESLAQLDAFFDKLATVQVHADWGRKMSDFVVSGSSCWEVLRIRS